MRRRATTSVVISAAVHVGIVGAVAYASASEPLPPPATRPDTLIVFHPPPPNVPRPAGPTSPTPARPTDPPRDPYLPPAPPIPWTTQPFDVPETLPPVDTRLGDVFARDTARLSVVGPKGEGGGGEGHSPMPNAYADKPALALPANPAPRYPEMLRAAGVAGSVTMRFVIDSAGWVIIRTAEARHSDHELFTAAVLAVLPRMRFLPAEANGRTVRVLVEQRFEFRLER